MFAKRFRHSGGFLMVCWALAQGAAHGQSAEPPPPSLTSFEVASVKPNNSGAERSALAQLGPGTFFAQNSTVRNLIRAAYDVRLFQVVGGDDWIDVDRYDITAKLRRTPAAANADEWPQVELGLRDLLEDRFGLKIHFETRLLPQLVVHRAKGGVTLTRHDGDCADREGGGAAGPTPPKNTLTYCGTIRWSKDGEPARIQGRAINMAGLILVLSTISGQIVRDETGVPDAFDINLQWSTDDSGGGLFTALREQLGLDVKSERGPVQVIVVDDIRRPSPD